MSVAIEAASEEVIVITSASRGVGFMTVVAAKERDGKLVLSPREGQSLKYTERLTKSGVKTQH